MTRSTISRSLLSPDHRWCRNVRQNAHDSHSGPRISSHSVPCFVKTLTIITGHLNALPMAINCYLMLLKGHGDGKYRFQWFFKYSTSLRWLAPLEHSAPCLLSILSTGDLLFKSLKYSIEMKPSGPSFTPKSFIQGILAFHRCP